MRFFTPLLPLTLTLGLGLLALRPAAAKIYDVQVGVNGNNYAPVTLPPINLGDQVRFVFVSGFHPTVSDSPTPAWATFTLSSGSTTFTTAPFTVAGTYPYHCSAHSFQNANGTWSGMVGTITVSATPLAAALGQAAGPALSLAPNPAQGQVLVQLGAAVGPAYRLRLSNVLGREVRALTLTSAATAAGAGQPLDLGGLPAGLYFCSLLQGDKTLSTTRLTVQ